MEPPILADLIDQAEAEFVLALAQLGKTQEAARVAQKQCGDLKRAKPEARATR